MTTNHIYLVLGFIEELKDLAMVQHWIDGARLSAANNQELQLVLDRKQSELDGKRDHIHELMFEISRSN